MESIQRVSRGLKITANMLFWEVVGAINLFLEPSSQKTLVNFLNILNDIGKNMGMIDDPLSIQLWGEKRLYDKINGKIALDYESIRNLLNDQNEQMRLGIGKEEDDHFYGLKDIIKALYTLEVGSYKRESRYDYRETMVDLREDLDFINRLNDNNYIYFIASLLCTDQTDYSEMKNINMLENYVKEYIDVNCGPKKVEPVQPRLSKQEKINNYRMRTRREASTTKKEQLRMDAENLLLDDNIIPDDATIEQYYNAIQEARKIQEAQSLGSQPASQLTVEEEYERQGYDSDFEPYLEQKEEKEQREEKEEVDYRGIRGIRGIKRSRLEDDEEPPQRRPRLGGKRKTKRRHYKKTRKIHKKRHGKRKTHNGRHKRRVLKSRRR